MSSGDPRAAVLVQQFRKEGCISRKVEGSRLQVKVEWTTDDLDVELDRPVTSRPVRVTDQASGRGLTFVVEVGRGIFRTLTGEAEGPWPRRWSVDPDELAQAAVGAVSLDARPLAELSDVAGMLGVPIDGLRDVAVHAAATDEELASVEGRGEHLPAEFKSLLRVTDGARFGDVAVLGVQDLHTVDFGESGRWWLVGQHADGERHFVCSDRGVAAVPEPRADPETLEMVAPNYLTWVRSLLPA